ncbi:hypothetical protein [Catenulispora rubra]|uniref:hypothetical protein n=1 Tax=Catenulispora rubra TaxID=280293 RepID=UPI0018922335|nr:hypothetical protein [Catenulispora rubra]
MTNPNLNPEAAAVSSVLAGFRFAIGERSAVIAHPGTAPEVVARLTEANRIDSGHADVAEALIGALNADPGRPYIQHVLVGGLMSQGKTASLRLAQLAALHDAEFDIAAVDGIDAARLVHDHQAPGCPACLLQGAGDLAALDGIEAPGVTE